MTAVERARYNRSVMSNSTPLIEMNDIVRLRKKHPCGSFHWRVVRLGVDIGLVCCGCRRRILLPRGKFNKQLKRIDNHFPCGPDA